METILLSYEPAVRLGFFFAVFAIMVAWELMAPRRALRTSKALRWTNNLALALINSAVVRIILPASAVAIAEFAAERGMGLFNFLTVSYPLSILLSVLALDLTIYLQHRMLHAVPLLWRVHRMHHADVDVDLTTGARFHPFEIVLSTLLKFAVILVMGAPALAVFVFEVLLNATSMFNHGNVRMPASVDRVMRWLVVTPDMHRVHHSVSPRETNSNFGFNLPWWDRLFGTYRAQPQAGHERMVIGIGQFRSPRELWLDRLLLQPFRRKDGGYTIGRREQVVR